LFELARQAQARGWSAEDLLRREVAKQERVLRRQENAERAAVTLEKLPAISPPIYNGRENPKTDFRRSKRIKL
jgi:hypothetical protein